MLPSTCLATSHAIGDGAARTARRSRQCQRRWRHSCGSVGRQRSYDEAVAKASPEPGASPRRSRSASPCCRGSLSRIPCSPMGRSMPGRFVWRGDVDVSDRGCVCVLSNETAKRMMPRVIEGRCGERLAPSFGHRRGTGCSAAVPWRWKPRFSDTARHVCGHTHV